jgi:hypothetical protein
MNRRAAARRARAIALTVLVAVVAAACGSAKADYGAQVTQVQDRYRAAITKEVTAGAALYATDPIGAQMRLAHAAADAHRLAVELAALDAPAGKEAAAVKLVNVYRSLAASLDALAGATKAHDPASLQAILTKLQTARVDEQAAVTALNG